MGKYSPHDDILVTPEYDRLSSGSELRILPSVVDPQNILNPTQSENAISQCAPEDQERSLIEFPFGVTKKIQVCIHWHTHYDGCWLWLPLRGTPCILICSHCVLVIRVVQCLIIQSFSGLLQHPLKWCCNWQSPNSNAWYSSSLLQQCWLFPKENMARSNVWWWTAMTYCPYQVAF